MRFDETGVPQLLTRVGAGWQYHPVAIAQQALRYYNEFAADESSRALERVVAAANWFVASQDRRDGKWHYRYDYPLGDDAWMRAPWSSALAQGQAISVLTRIYDHTGSRVYLDAATHALVQLTRSVDEGGLTAAFFGHPFYEEYPTEPPSFVLNGLMFTLIGLYDLATADPDGDAPRLYSEGIETLAYALPFYDAARLGSFYNLTHVTTPPRRAALAGARYHAIHVALLRALASVAPDRMLVFYRDRWARPAR